MAWRIASRRLLFGTTATATLACYYSLRKPIIFADNNNSSQTAESHPPKLDPLVNHSWMVSDTSGWYNVRIIQYDYACLPNQLDRYANMAFHAVRMNHGCNWVFASLNEGLRGWETSVFAFKAIIPSITYVLESLIRRYTTRLGDPNEMYPSAELSKQVPSEEFDKEITKAFGDVEYAIVNQARDMIFSSPSKALNTHQLAAAIAGSVSMVAFYDDGTRILKIANVGDCRAVLGRQAEREDGTQYLKVEVLTCDHTSKNPAEQARFSDTHSEAEVSIIQKHIGRDVTRAFGLAMCKWSQDVQERMHREYLGEPPLQGLSSTRTLHSPTDIPPSPPYITAEPDITTVRVGPSDFLIMGNKGLWDSLTNEEAVGLIGAWLVRRNYRLTSPITEPSENDFVSRGMLPVDFPPLNDDDDVSEKEKEKEKEERKEKEKGEGEGRDHDTTTWYKRWNLTKEFICVDNNAAIHLVRNALGGAHRAFTEGLLMVPHPFCANSRSELAVAVIFFE